MGATLDYRDGWLCAKDEDVMLNEPVKTIYWWPLIRDFRQIWEDDLGKELYYHRATHTYSLRIGGFWREFRLAQGGQTQAIAYESMPVEKPPRVRLPLRWHYGRWEKETSKGWERV